MKKSKEALAEKLDALGHSLSKKRSQSISHRASCGIETDWTEDEEFYEGVDAVNRQDTSAWKSKPPGQITPIKGETRSTVFINITRPYTDAAASRIADMLLPTDERNYTIQPTPVPDSLSDLANGILRPEHEKMIQDNLPPEQRAAAILQAAQAANQYIQDIKKKAKKAELRIDDWLVECQYSAELRKVIEDAAKVGTGVLKGPIPAKKKHQAFLMDGNEGKIVIKEETKPISKHISFWNLYPDPACGENIHNGSFIWEVDNINKKQLRDLKGGEGPSQYIDEQIDACLEEGPQKATADPEHPYSKGEESEDQYQIWYYHGTVDSEDMEAAGCECEENEMMDAVITMVNNRVIKAAINHMDTGEFPYDVMRWQRRVGEWAGIGVSRQIRTPQKMVNAAARNMMDNAGLGAGGIIIMKQGAIIPADGEMSLTPRKLFYVNETEVMDDVGKALRFIQIPMVQKELMDIIQFALKMAEDVTGLPMLLQGQQGKAPETVGGMQMLNNNASGVLRRLAKIFDDYITEPHIRRYYSYLLQYGENPEEKGDFLVYAKASSALIERDLQSQAIVQWGPMVLNPAFGMSPKLWAEEQMKAQRLDPENFKLTEEEIKAMQQQQQQGQGDQMALQVKKELLMMKLKAEEMENDKDRQLDLALAKMTQEVEAMKLSGKKTISTDELKTSLAKAIMGLKTQKELSAASLAIDVQKDRMDRMTPPTEPSGRAKTGRAYQA